MKHILILFSLCTVMVLDSPSATAQTQLCDQRAKVIGHLAQKYQEAPVAIGVTTSGGMVEVLTSGDGGTWTIILSNPNGTSCLVAAGEGWRNLKYDSSQQEPVI